MTTQGIKSIQYRPLAADFANLAIDSARSGQTFFHICSDSVRTCHRLFRDRLASAPDAAHTLLHIVTYVAKSDLPLLPMLHILFYIYLHTSQRIHSGPRQSHVPAIARQAQRAGRQAQRAGSPESWETSPESWETSTCKKAHVKKHM